ncbi:phage virion morphogenesis protein [Dyadobacter frigoris]|nr:phage virion morphogenesis protein [Dyadobacter frigoris]
MKTAAAAVKKLMEDDAYTIIGVEGEKHFKKSFRDEGFTDESLEKWTPLKPASEERKRKKNGSVPPILTDKGHLSDAVDWHKGNGSVVFTNDRPYAEIHNEGGEIRQGARSETFQRNRGEKNKFAKGTTPGKGFAFKEKTIEMPQRQFMGPSKVLEEKIISKIEKQLDKIFKQ